MALMDLDDPRGRTVRMLAETWAVLAALVAVAVATRDSWIGPFVGLLLGCWFHRLYTAGHEATHRKLWPTPRGNDLLGQLLLLPIGVPLPVYRRIHGFHHAHNRRDAETSALDVVVVSAPPSALRRAVSTARWYAMFLLGGHFFEGLVSIVALCALPVAWTRRLHPALRGWTASDRWASVGVFVAFVALHVGVATAFGGGVWYATLGRPLLAFAWVYSLITYIYHARATIGPEVRANTRALPTIPVVSWWLLDFNEHVTHHADPSLPWWQLRANRAALPAGHADNEDVSGFLAAILAQLRGPTFVVKP